MTDDAAIHDETDLRRVEDFRGKCGQLKAGIHQAMVGQDEVIDLLLCALFARGHALLIGVPGLGKTLLVKTLASALGWDFKRIQFTPDLMPSDITGTEILQSDPSTGNRHLRFVKGPLFANLILADEINRTPPKTQSALLEAMQEYAVTVAGRTLPLEPPFAVVATQNPIEQEGTYPLPEAQLDRFMFSLAVDYPDAESEIQIVDTTTTREFPPVSPVFDREQVLAMQALVRRVPASRHVIEYAVALARFTRPTGPKPDAYVRNYVEWGAGPRASQCLVLGAKVKALLAGRTAPSCDDVRTVAQAVLAHRLVPNYNAAGEGVKARDIVAHILAAVKEPSYTGARA